jgi:hypothetical protein
VLLFWLCGCEVASDEGLVQPSVLDEPLVVAEALYAVDRPGPDAQRASMLVWLRSLALDEEQRESLHVGSGRVRTALVSRDEDLAALEVRQNEAQAAALASLEAQLVSGEVPQTLDLVTEDPRPIEAAYVVFALDAAEGFVETLSVEQTPAMGNALFLLRPRLTVGDYEGLLGRPWAPGDFATMRRAGSGDQAPLDPGGLFTLDEGATSLTAELDRERVVVLTALAMEHPQLQPALDLLAP